MYFYHNLLICTFNVNWSVIAIIIKEKYKINETKTKNIGKIYRKINKMKKQNNIKIDKE